MEGWASHLKKNLIRVTSDNNAPPQPNSPRKEQIKSMKQSISDRVLYVNEGNETRKRSKISPLIELRRVARVHEDVLL